MDQWQTEALKLTAQGVSIIVSSGDSGAPGYVSTLGCLCSYDSSSASSQWAVSQALCCHFVRWLT